MRSHRINKSLCRLPSVESETLQNAAAHPARSPGFHLDHLRRSRRWGDMSDKWCFYSDFFSSVSREWDNELKNVLIMLAGKEMFFSLSFNICFLYYWSESVRLFLKINWQIIHVWIVFNSYINMKWISTSESISVRSAGWSCLFFQPCHSLYSIRKLVCCGIQRIWDRNPKIDEERRSAQSRSSSD